MADRANSLGPTDRQMIRLLQEDGRLSTVELSRRLGISEPTARKRLNQLIGDGTIRIRAVADPVQLGYEAAAFIGIDVERSYIGPVADILKQFPFVDSVSVTTGPYDIIIQASFETLRDLYQFILVELASVEGIKDSQSFMILRSEKVGSLLGVAGLDWPPPQG
jgi:Lrp/AsnC family transcriptional regulator for asnA, asnC and gidA